jgi:hypothetical protein
VVSVFPANFFVTVRASDWARVARAMPVSTKRINAFLWLLMFVPLIIAVTPGAVIALTRGTFSGTLSPADLGLLALQAIAIVGIQVLILSWRPDGPPLLLVVVLSSGLAILTWAEPYWMAVLLPVAAIGFALRLNLLDALSAKPGHETIRRRPPRKIGVLLLPWTRAWNALLSLLKTALSIALCGIYLHACAWEPRGQSPSTPALADPVWFFNEFALLCFLLVWMHNKGKKDLPPAILGMLPLSPPRVIRRMNARNLGIFLVGFPILYAIVFKNADVSLFALASFFVFAYGLSTLAIALAFLGWEWFITAWIVLYLGVGVLQGPTHTEVAAFQHAPRMVNDYTPPLRLMPGMKSMQRFEWTFGGDYFWLLIGIGLVAVGACLQYYALAVTRRPYEKGKGKQATPGGIVLS